jgi:hypothetical protein
MSAPVPPAREPLPLRECAPCRIWTECGRCPDCGAHLGEPPFAAPVRPGELDNLVPFGPPRRPVPAGARS